MLMIIIVIKLDKLTFQNIKLMDKYYNLMIMFIEDDDISKKVKSM